MNTLKMCFWNANGLSHHKNEVQNFLYTYQIDVMLISETHFSDKNCFRINDYYTYDAKHPSGRACGGAAILVHKDIRHFPLPEFTQDYIQATSINLPYIGVTISALYCPPRHNICKDQFLDYFNTLGPKFIAAGDYNAKHTFWGSRLITPRGRQLLDAVSSNRMDALSAGHPTYWPTDLNKIPDVIDFAVVRNIRRENLRMHPSLDLSSDHSPTILTFVPDTNLLEQNYLQTRTNWRKYKMFVSSHLPSNISLKCEQEIESGVRQFTNILTEAARVSTSSTPLVRKRKFPCSNNIEALLRQKRNLRRQWQEYRSPGLKSQLNQCQRLLRDALQKHKESNLQKYLQNLDATKDSEYSLWKAVRKMRRPTLHESPLRLQHGDWAKSAEQKVDAFANYLENVFTPNNSVSSIAPVTIDDVVSRPIKFRLSAVIAVIQSLKPNKSPGCDKITATMIKNLPTSAVRFILFIFNSMLRIGYFPASWKLSDLVMIPKPGKDITQVSSYRPISLLPILSKMFEKMLLNSLIPHIDANAIVPDHQFGFRRKHSTIQQVHRITNLIRRAFENKQYCSALFIDISQAFDKVWHEGLLFKITQFLPKNVHKLLKSYLWDRYFQIKSKDVTSSRRKISAGVPQGSILGPFLYLLFTADMPTSLVTHTSTFADDTAFLSIHRDSTVASQRLQSHVSDLENWMLKWKIKVNVSKCMHITFTLRRGNCPPIKINGVTVPEHSSVKYLGIHLDRRLTWAHHIAAKITQIKLRTAQLYWLIGPKSTLDLELKLLLYKSVLKPIWLYGIQLWGTASPSNVEKLQRRQSRLLRIITGAPWYMRNSNIHKDLKVPLVREEIKIASVNYISRITEHPNRLVRDLLVFEGHRRLKRVQTNDLIR